MNIPTGAQCERCRLSFEPYAQDIDDARDAIDNWRRTHTCTPWREKHRQRRTPLTGRLFLWLLDRAELHTGEWCQSYGGCLHGRVRICDKPRWHWDSHTYEFVDVLMAKAGTVVDGRPEKGERDA